MVDTGLTVFSVSLRSLPGFETHLSQQISVILPTMAWICCICCCCSTNEATSFWAFLSRCPNSAEACITTITLRWQPVGPSHTSNNIEEMSKQCAKIVTLICCLTLAYGFGAGGSFRLNSKRYNKRQTAFMSSGSALKPVILAPAQFGTPNDYDDLTHELKIRGYQLIVAPLSRFDWYC